MTGEMKFADRSDAGRRLAEAIVRRGSPEDPVIVALPRGGVPVAAEIAARLGAPLDLLFVRKIGAPGAPEVGIGAIVEGNPPRPFLNSDTVRDAGAGKDYIAACIEREVAEMVRQRRTYLGDKPALPVEDRNVIVVDDGIATGGTVLAAIHALRLARARSILLAVPVAPAEMVGELSAAADDLVCLVAPEDFRAVSMFYARFPQTSDQEVMDTLKRAERRG